MGGSLTQIFANLCQKIKLDSASATLSISSEDMVVFVVGPTGSGKSWFIKEATKSDLVKTSKGYHPSTTTAQAIRCDLKDDTKKDMQKEGVNLKSIVFVDTPSFFTECHDIDPIKAIKKLIGTQSRPGSLRIIYMHRIANDPEKDPVHLHLQELRNIPWIVQSPNPVRVHIVASYDTRSGRLLVSKIKKHINSLEMQAVSLDGGRWKTTVNQEQFQGSPEEAWTAVGELLRGLDRDTQDAADNRQDTESCKDGGVGC